MASKNPQEMMAFLSTSMQKRTRKSLEEWLKAVHASGDDPLNQKTVRNWPKNAHQVPQNSQCALADTAATAAGWQCPSQGSYTDSQYAGEKAALRPIFDQLRQLAEACGEDVAMEGRGGCTPFVHKRQFMAVEPGSKTKVTSGLRFKAAPVLPLLEEGKAPG